MSIEEKISTAKLSLEAEGILPTRIYIGTKVHYDLAHILQECGVFVKAGIILNYSMLRVYIVNDDPDHIHVC